jgi:3-oxoacyl-[acyl-carrier protein] reductase
MQIDLRDRVVLVTGAGSGIGRAMASAFAAAEASVWVNDLSEDAADETVRAIRAQGGAAHAVAADVTRADAVTAMVNTIVSTEGRIDCLVNNAAIVQVKPFLELEEEDWDRMLTTNLKSVFLTCRAVLPQMQRQGAGVVINLASELAWLGRASYAPYTASKGGVIALTRSLAREFAPEIRVNGIAPGPVDTPMLRSEMALTDADETTIPAGRLGRPEEIAAAAVFLASDAAGFFYGEIISPNGGALMR